MNNFAEKAALPHVLFPYGQLPKTPPPLLTILGNEFIVCIAEDNEISTTLIGRQSVGTYPVFVHSSSVAIGVCGVA